MPGNVPVPSLALETPTDQGTADVRTMPPPVAAPLSFVGAGAAANIDNSAGLGRFAGEPRARIRRGKENGGAPQVNRANAPPSFSLESGNGDMDDSQIDSSGVTAVPSSISDSTEKPDRLALSHGACVILRWSQRNDCVFDSVTMSVHLALSRISFPALAMALLSQLGKALRSFHLFECQQTVDVINKLSHKQVRRSVSEFFLTAYSQLAHGATDLFHAPSILCVQQYTGWAASLCARAYFEMADYKMVGWLLKLHLCFLFFPLLLTTSFIFLQANDYFRLARRVEAHRVENMEVFSTVLWHLRQESALATLSQEVFCPMMTSVQSAIALTLFSFALPSGSEC